VIERHNAALISSRLYRHFVGYEGGNANHDRSAIISGDLLVRVPCFFCGIIGPDGNPERPAVAGHFVVRWAERDSGVDVLPGLPADPIYR